MIIVFDKPIDLFHTHQILAVSEGWMLTFPIATLGEPNMLLWCPEFHLILIFWQFQWLWYRKITRYGIDFAMNHGLHSGGFLAVVLTVTGSLVQVDDILPQNREWHNNHVTFMSRPKLFANSRACQVSWWELTGNLRCLLNISMSFCVKGALDNILKFYFWLNFIYHVKCNC